MNSATATLDRTQVDRRISALSAIALAAAFCSFALLVSGSVLRLTNTGLACSDWPLCYSAVLPYASTGVFFDVAHRVLTALSGAFVLASALLAWFWRANASARRISATALALTVAQVLLGAVLVWAQLQTLDRVLHLTVGLAMFGCVAVLPAVLRREPVMDERTPRTRAYQRSLTLLAALVFVVLVTGSLVSANGAALACGATWPLCNGGLFPNGGSLAFAQWMHRALSVLVVMHAVGVWRRARRSGAQVSSDVKQFLDLVLAGLLAQMALGIAMVLFERPAILSTLHNAVGALTWAGSLLATIGAARAPLALPEPAQKQKAAWRQTVDDYVALTKPKVVSLLLFTTVTAMFLTPRGVPPWHLVLFATIAGYLMVGAANAYNMWFDRDIDAKMGRTSLRPIPSGRITPARALVFSFTLLATSLLIYVLFVTVLAAALALLGFVYYTIIYTSWLKRSTWQNIVIGGGAGAVPPLIGWAAASGSLSLSALVLFLIIFYWTPPHFWALALMKQKDYAAAGIPMLPVIGTEDETARQMLIYSVGMFALSLILTPMGAMGLLYLAGAVALGAVFVWYAWRVLRARTPKHVWGLYGYSLLYLALLFLLMVADRLTAG